MIGLLVLDAGVELCNFTGFDKVIDADKSVTAATCNKRILMAKFSNHDFTLLLYGALQAQLLLELHLLNYPALI